MDRRAFVILTAAGMVNPGLSPVPGLGPDPGQAPAPEQSVDGTPSGSGDPQFDAWLASFYQRSATAGFPLALLQRELAGLTPDPRVVALDNRQPELSKPIGDYMRSAVSDRAVGAGRDKLEGADWLPPIVERFGVPGPILVSIWGEESNYGAQQGDMDVIRSLATLAADGRRRDWAEGQIWDALRMIASGEVTREQMKGSWAGAMGQTQMIPEAFLADAVDGDGDGRRDIWGSPADALASAANLLDKYGWMAGGGWAREVLLPEGFDYGVTEGPRQTPVEWALQGVRAASGPDWSAEDAASPAQLITPAGAAGPAFLVFPNHFVIRRYNNSTSYALAVGLLADRIAGAPPLLAGWPVEPPMTAEDRLGAQQALASLGFDPGAPDGVIGLNTRAAVRAWQKSRGLPADGYLTAALSHRLQEEAAAAAPPAPASPAATRN